MEIKELPVHDYVSSPVRISLPSKSAAPKLDDNSNTMTVSGPNHDDLWSPIVGPSHPYLKDHAMHNDKLGFVQDAHTESFVFDEQYNTFYKFGYAADPSENTYVGDVQGFNQNEGVSVYNIPKQKKKKRKLENENEVDDYPDMDTWLKSKKSPWAGKKDWAQGELTEEQKKYAEEHAKKKAAIEFRGDDQKQKIEAHADDKTIFHGKEEKDYQGRPWIAPPKHVNSGIVSMDSKRLVHTWTGHTKGVSAIRFFPNHGHLILSAGKDSKVKIWDVSDSGKCMRTYMGHNKAATDVWFSNDGTKFLSAGYDSNIKYWDTETGQVISTFSTGKTPYIVRLNPDEDKQNVLLAGTHDKKIVQWDINTGQITQVYDQHLGAVNTITFVDDNRRFVTSSDDMSLRVWEYGIPVVIKTISEPHMHSMPSVALHPNSNWIACQSLDDQIVVYSAREKFQVNHKKRFVGHRVDGHACQVNFSPDGRIVMSGDSEGKCWFWDWNSCKVVRTLKCHDGVCIGAEWHPLDRGRVATCGWDGLIKYWQVV